MYRGKRAPQMVTPPGRRTAAILSVAAFALIGVMTLRPASTFVATPIFCVFCGALGGVDFALNTVLFVPLGLGLRWLLGRWTVPLVIGAATTLLIESLQWRLIPGRDASIGDLIANTLGALIGVLLATASIRWLNAPTSAARPLSAAAGILTAIFIWISALLLLPAAPRYAQYVQWTPPHPNTDLFQGRLVSATLNGTEIPPTGYLPSQAVLDSVTREISVGAAVEPPVPRSRRQAIIVRIANSLEEGFLLAQRGEAVVFRTNLAATHLRLRPLLLGLDRGFSGSEHLSGDTPGTVRITALSGPRSMSVRRAQPSGESSITLRRTIGLAWALLLPWDLAIDPSWWPANALWLAGLVMPVTFFTMRSGRGSGLGHRARFFRWPLPLVLATIAIGPSIVGLSAPGPGDWIGVLAGLATGLLVERLTAPSREVILTDSAPVGPGLP